LNFTFYLKLKFSNLDIYAYQDYIKLPESSNKENVISNMNELKSINNEYLKRIIKLNSEQEIENNIVYEIMQETKAKRRLQFSAIFYFSFYAFGATVISNHYAHTMPTRMFLLLFLYVPNLIFYNKKFKERNAKVQEILLRHSFSKIPITKDRSLIERFIQEYLYFYNQNKLI
jgi:hypothetical protein